MVEERKVFVIERICVREYVSTYLVIIIIIIVILFIYLFLSIRRRSGRSLQIMYIRISTGHCHNILYCMDVDGNTNNNIMIAYY